VNAVGSVLHLRLRSALHGFAPSPVQHTRRQRGFVPATDTTLFLFPSSGFGAAARFKMSNFHEMSMRLESPAIRLSRKNLA
jgi:hypothetical protein